MRSPLMIGMISKISKIGCLGLLGGLALACSSGSESSDGDTYTTLGCTPGEQRACPCPGGQADGVQVCGAMGDHYDACSGCDLSDEITTGASTGADSTASSSAEPPASTSDTSASDGGEDVSSGAPDDPCAGTAHCSNGEQDCGEPHIDCGSNCPDVPYYTWCDCLIDTPRNGSEVCDDTGFDVRDPSPIVMVCLEATGGQVYVATNTSIDPNDNAMRCSGWELMGQNPWDHLEYIVGPLTCDAEQKTSEPFDLTPYAGETLWFGAHDHPMGGGSGTTACIAHPK